MPILVEQSTGQQIVKIEGDFDAATAVEARRVFEDIAAHNTQNVLLDCSHVEFIDSSGVGAIVFLYKRLRCSGRELSLSGLQTQPYELLKLLRIDQIISTQRMGEG
jgi:anti-anti-sigma factor